MRGATALSISALAATAAAASASNTTCASLYILCAKGSGEPVKANNASIPDNVGTPGAIALGIQAALPGVVIAGVDCPAYDPVESYSPLKLDLAKYYPSENTGAKNMLEDVVKYNEACPDSKIALMGYSQGAEVVRDVICGGPGGNSNSYAPISPELVEKNVVAIAIFGDPTYNANVTIDRGTATNSGFLPRPNTTVCDQYNNFTASWCDKGDPICAQGNDAAVHESYYAKYGEDIGKFIVEKYTDAVTAGSSTSGTSGGNSTTGGGSSPSKTSSGAPAATSTDKPGSASGLVVSQSLLIGAAVWVVSSLL